MSGVQKFTESNINDIKNGLCGVYAIYDEEFSGAIAYLGRAKGTSGSCIKTRLRKHLRGTDRQLIGGLVSQRPEDFYFSYAEMRSYEDAKEAEGSELLRLLPSANLRFESSNLRELKEINDED
jgi:hypothetical protein